MRKYFAPPNEGRRLQDEWANLRQHGSVSEYVSVLMVLAARIPELSQGQILDKFIRGLKPKTKIEVELQDPKTPDKAYGLADRFD
jgi:Retrotransposon gag protein